MSHALPVPASLDALRTLLQSKVAATKATDVVKARKSVKAQRKAATKATTARAAKAEQAMPSTTSWSLPVAFDIWSRRECGTRYATPNAALDAGQSKLVVDYNRYVRDTFETPVSFDESGSFSKIVARQYSKQLQGFSDLGLLGYSAIDIAQLAVFYAWVDRISVWLTQTGCDEDTVSTISQALRDLRSDDELRAAAQLGMKHRYAFGSDNRLRKQTNHLAVRKARKFLAARRLVALYPVWDYAPYLVPTAGAVYRQIGHVFREGMREFNNIREGLTRDGEFTSSIEFVALEVGDTVSPVVKSAEAQYFDVQEFEEQQLERETTLAEFLAKPSILPAEAAAAEVVFLLMQGSSLWDIREKFDSESDFRQAVTNAQQLFAA